MCPLSYTSFLVDLRRNATTSNKQRCNDSPPPDIFMIKVENQPSMHRQQIELTEGLFSDRPLFYKAILKNEKIYFSREIDQKGF